MLKKLLMLEYPKFSVVGDEDEGEGGGSADGNPSGEGNEPVKDQDAEWVSERGAKNVREELNRKSDELKKLRTEIESLKSQPKEPPKVEKPASKGDFDFPPEIQEHYDWLVEKYGDKDYAEHTCKAMLKVAINASRSISQGVTDERFKSFSKVQKRLQNEALADSIKSIGADKRFKSTVSVYEKEITEYMKNEVDPAYWEDEKVIKSVIGLINAEHLGDPEKPISPKIERVNETDNFGSGKGTEGVSSEDLQEYAEIHNLDISNPVIRKAAIKGAMAMIKAKKRIE